MHTPDGHRVLSELAVATGLRGLLTIATGYAENGLTPRVTSEVERSLFEVTTAVRLEAFDQDAFADDVERGVRGTEAVTRLVEAALDLLAAVFGLIAVAVAVAVIHPLLFVALLQDQQRMLRWIDSGAPLFRAGASTTRRCTWRPTWKRAGMCFSSITSRPAGGCLRAFIRQVPCRNLCCRRRLEAPTS